MIERERASNKRARERARQRQREGLCVYECVGACLRPRLGLIRSLAIYSPRTGYIIGQDVDNTATQELYSPWYAMLPPFIPDPCPSSPSLTCCTALHKGASSTHRQPPATSFPMAHGSSVASSSTLHLHHLAHHNWLLPQMTPTDRLPQASKLAHQTPTRPRGKTTSRRLNRNLCQSPTRSCNQNPASVLRLATSSQSPTRTRQPRATM